MAVSTNYATPVQVNGFTCKNCTDVDEAKKHIDPAHPKSGPYNVDAKSDPTRSNAVSFGGSLSGLNATHAVAPTTAPRTTSAGATATTSQASGSQASGSQGSGSQGSASQAVGSRLDIAA